MKTMHKILLWTTLITFGGTVLTSIPLFVNYLKGIEPKFPIFVDLHVWVGAIFMIVVITRLFINQEKIKAMLKS
jgi:cytochrome b561